MWYFAWILGIVAAVSLGIINVMWYEVEGNDACDEKPDGTTPL